MPLIPIIAVLALLVILSGIFTVKQQSAALVERFGRFQSVKRSGLQFKIPFADNAVKGKDKTNIHP